MSALYSVVRDVEPGARCSYRRGRTEVAFFDDQRSAAGYADCCSIHHEVAGMRYVVEVLTGDEDPRRAPNDLMRRDAERAEIASLPATVIIPVSATIRS